MFNLFILILSLTWGSQTRTVPTEPQDPETLIVFLQSEKDQAFVKQSLPQLKSYCRSNQIALVVKEAEQGLPAEISSTPAIVFQTSQKRLIYAGRYQQFSSIENFVRTSRFRTPSETEFCKEAVWIKQVGRTQLMAVAKITDLKGSLASDYDAKRFAQQAQKSISQALPNYLGQEQACIKQTDRVFYLDFYPYRADDGRLYLSLALYSQFSCVEPIYVANALESPSGNWDSLFAHAAQDFAKQIDLNLAQSTIGDALSSVSAAIPISSWQSLGLAFPAGAKQKSVAPSKLEKLAGDWTYDGAPDPRIPALSFHFQAPLERYAGEVSQMEGKLTFDEKDRLVKGKFVVAVSSLSMGMADLDEKVLRKYLKVKKFPEASFEFDLQENPLRLDQSLQKTVIAGRFSLMNQEVELPMQAQFQMITDDAGRPQLWASGQFALNITQDFGIEGPDGPSPNRETMIFYFSLLLNSQN